MTSYQPWHAIFRSRASGYGGTVPPSRSGTYPFRFAVYDSWAPSHLVAAARRDWPADDWPGWFRYDSPGEQKLAAREGLPAACRELLDWMQGLCPPGLVADPTLHGGGLHMIPDRGRLDVHLDCDRHPVTRYRRALNAILFLDNWEHGWWGNLHLYWPSLVRCVAITPTAGRLVLFETGDDSYHGVPGPVRHPEQFPRRSLAVYFWEPVAGEATRPRAQFVAMPGETPDPVRDAWRKERMQ